ncbi:unnamed protein product, partial [Musa textilis]
ATSFLGFIFHRALTGHEMFLQDIILKGKPSSIWKQHHHG